MWYTSRKSGLTPSLQATLAQIPVDFCLYLYYFFPPRLPHYVVILDYFSHSVFLLHSVSHTHAHTKPISILQCLCCDELSCEMAGCYIREESAVSQRTSQRSAERDQIKERGRGFTLKSVQRESQMRIYGQQATVTHRQLLALFVIISVFLAIDSLCSVTKGKLLHVHLFFSSLPPRLLFSLLCALCIVTHWSEVQDWLWS